MSASAIDRRLQAGIWEAVLPGVYRIRGHTTSLLQRAMAACLWGGKDTYCSDRSAAALWKLEGVDPSGSVHVVCPRRLRHPLVVVHRRKDLCSRRDMTTLGPIRITTVTRTLIDMAGTGRPHDVASALDHALRDRLTTVPRLMRRFDELASRGRPGSALMQRLLAERSLYDSPPHTDLERRFLRLIVSAKLALPTPQFVVTERGDFVAQVDFAYPDLLIAIEMDSYDYHLDPQAFQTDRTRASRLASMGWLVLLFTWDDLARRPAFVVSRVTGALQARRPTLLG